MKLSEFIVPEAIVLDRLSYREAMDRLIATLRKNAGLPEAPPREG